MLTIRSICAYCTVFAYLYVYPVHMLTRIYVYTYTRIRIQSTCLLVYVIRAYYTLYMLTRIRIQSTCSLVYTYTRMQMEVSEGQEKLRALFEDQQYRAQAARAEKSSEGLATQVQELRLKCISKSGHSSA